MSDHKNFISVGDLAKKIGKSEILNDIKISALISEFPSMLRMSTWELIYSMNHDGCSMVTFYQKCA